MADQMIFKRYEMKYMLNRSQAELLKEKMKQYMIADEHGVSTICSLYFDTPEYLLIRRSMDHPVYKEKLRLLLSYEREAFYAKDDHEFRITFDKNILWRDYDLSLCDGIYGEPILKEDQILMEVKTGGAIPLWIAQFLSENKIYKTSFSKYAEAYRTICKRKEQGEKIC